MNAHTTATHIVATPLLDIAYHEYGSADGWPCILGHGFPYDPLAYSTTAPLLADAGARVIVPYLRGYGATRFRSANTPRSGEQAALASDLLALLDALDIDSAVLGGYDWGGRAACCVAALWPERVEALISGSSYNIQNIAASGTPAPAREEASYWYQYYFHNERGRRGLIENRREIAQLLWEMWSPSWSFTDEEFEASAASFENPDFVNVVIHSYRHRFGLAAGDPAFADIETRLAVQPDIRVPAVTIDGVLDGVDSGTADHAHKFTGPHAHRLFGHTGHNLPQEQPAAWAEAVLAARAMATGSAA